ncbi:MAG: hypothetical protein KF908_10035 [Nitrosomonas sp.]|nr:hypothetical protein [Nitrosomonas sp.]
MHNNIRLLLQLVQQKSDISFLLQQGLTYTQISALFEKAVRQDWLKFYDDSFHLTDLGKQVLQEETSNKTMGHQSMWISADERFVIPQIDIDDIFLPKKKDSYFS